MQERAKERRNKEPLTQKVKERIRELTEEKDRLEGYKVNIEDLVVKDPQLAGYLVGPMQRMRLIVSERKDGSMQVQAHAHYRSGEVQALSLQISENDEGTLYEYKLAYDEENRSIFTTPVPKGEVREETWETFLEFFRRVKKAD